MNDVRWCLLVFVLYLFWFLLLILVWKVSNLSSGMSREDLAEMRSDLRQARTWNDRLVVLVSWSPMIIRLFIGAGLSAIAVAGFAALATICGDAVHMWRAVREIGRDTINFLLRLFNRPLLPELPPAPPH